MSRLNDQTSPVCSMRNKKIEIKKKVLYKYRSVTLKETS